MRNKNFLKIQIAFYIAVILSALLRLEAAAQTPAISSGLSYLRSTQSPDGSWGGTASSAADIIPTTETVVEALRLLEPSPSSQQLLGRTFLANQPLAETDYIARRILALAGTASLDVADKVVLLSLQNRAGGAGFASDSGWGGLASYGSTLLDTALAVRALAAVGYNEPTVVGSAVNYLLAVQGSDGGWGLVQSNVSRIYTTALVMRALEAQQTAALNGALAAATGYLTSRQNPDGSFGESIFETALAFQALARYSLSPATRGAATQYLTSTQRSDGSWGEDPFATALAIQALADAQTAAQAQIQAIALSRVRTDGTLQPSTLYHAFETMEIGLTIGDPTLLREVSIHDSAGSILLPRSGARVDEYLFDTINFLPGAYSVTVRVFNPITNILVDEQSTTFAIEGSFTASNFAVGVSPAFTYVGASEAIVLNFSLSNRSNIAGQVSFQYDLKTPAGAALNSGTTLLPVAAGETAKTIPSATFQHTFTESGTYPVTVSVFNGAALLGTLNATISAAPAIRIDPRESLTPQEILPGGDKRIRIDIHLEGVEPPP